jgi:RHS repeat-associated protein
MWRWDADPFGTATPNQNPQSLGTFVYNLRFPGQYYQAETGLSQNYFRDYDPKTGRFPESDPIGLRGGINTYAYADGDPVSRKDPSGLFVPPPVLLPLAALEAAGAVGYGLGTYIYEKNSVQIQDFIDNVIKGPWPEKQQSISDILDEIMGEKKDVPNPSPDIENAGARNGRRSDCVNQCLDFLDRADGGASFHSCVSKCMKNSAPKSCQ